MRTAGVCGSPRIGVRSGSIGLAALLLMTCGACGPDDDAAAQHSGGTPDGSAQPTPTRSTASTAEVARISLEGTDAVPLHWRTPTVQDGPGKAVLLAAQRFTALGYRMGTVHDPDRLAPLFRALMTGDELTWRQSALWDHPSTQSPHQTSEGPMWIWMRAPRVGTNQATVDVCYNAAWWKAGNQHFTPPRDRWDRADHGTLTLHRTTNGWKVAQATLQSADAGDGGFSERCARWAAHTPRTAPD